MYILLSNIDSTVFCKKGGKTKKSKQKLETKTLNLNNDKNFKTGVDALEIAAKNNMVQVKTDYSKEFQISDELRSGIKNTFLNAAYDAERALCDIERYKKLSDILYNQLIYKKEKIENIYKNKNTDDDSKTVVIKKSNSGFNSEEMYEYVNGTLIRKSLFKGGKLTEFEELVKKGITNKYSNLQYLDKDSNARDVKSEHILCKLGIRKAFPNYVRLEGEISNSPVKFANCAWIRRFDKNFMNYKKIFFTNENGSITYKEVDENTKKEYKFKPDKSGLIKLYNYSFTNEDQSVTTVQFQGISSGNKNYSVASSNYAGNIEIQKDGKITVLGGYQNIR